MAADLDRTLAALADPTRRARLIQLRTGPLSELRSWVEDVEAMWGDQLQAFKVHADRVYRGRRR